jgi:transcriptional regulator with XRE-family HTH domain
MTEKLSPFSVWLKRTREAKGVTQDALADYLGQKKAAVSKWENKTEPEAIPPLDTLVRMCEKLETTIAEPLTELGYLPRGEKIEDLQARTLLRQYEKLPQHARALVTDIVKAVASHYPKELLIIEAQISPHKGSKGAKHANDG